MEDVVLHYQPGSAVGLSELILRTEKLLEPFPCRPPPVFTPWFPAADRRLPIKPAKPAPVITSRGQWSAAVGGSQHLVRPSAASSGTTPDKTKDGVSRTSDPLLRSPETGGVPVAKRSWKVFAQKGGVRQSSRSLSRHLRRSASIHRLHLRQRVRWVIGQHNCGAARDIEQVWRALTRSVPSCGLPTCNANIQRERGEIWVFCDLLHAEQVGGFLKEQLQLTGRISLSVHKLGTIHSL